MAPPVWVGTTKSTEGPNRTKLGWSPSCLPAYRAGTLDLSCPWTRIYTISYPALRPLDSNCSDTTSFPWSSASRQQILGLSSLRSCTGQTSLYMLLVLYCWKTLINTRTEAQKSWETCSKSHILNKRIWDLNLKLTHSKTYVPDHHATLCMALPKGGGKAFKGPEPIMNSWITLHIAFQS